MGDRKQPQPIPEGLKRPAPPPAPPKLDAFLPPTFQEVHPEAQSIVELAECVKDLIRIIKGSRPWEPHMHDRLDGLYRKASRAKDRVDV